MNGFYKNPATGVMELRETRLDNDGSTITTSLAEIPGTAYLGEINNLTTTRQQVSNFSTGVWAITLDYRQLTGTAGTRLFFVRNATSDADAGAKLGNASTREAINIAPNGAFAMPTLILADSLDSLITRLDVIAETAIGTDTTRLTFAAVGNAP